MLCGVRQAYGFWGLCEKFACETLLKAGFGLSSSPRGSLSERERDGGGGGGGGGKGRENAKTRKGEQSTESGHAITVVRCYGAQALSRWSKKHNHWLTPPPNPSPFFPLSFSPSPLFPYILFLPTPPDFRLSFPLFLSYLIFLTDLCCGLGAGY